MLELKPLLFMALSAPWRDCTCELLGREQERGTGEGRAGPSKNLGAVRLSGSAALIDLFGLACEHWPSSPLCSVVSFREDQTWRFQKGYLPAQVGVVVLARGRV